MKLTFQTPEDGVLKFEVAKHAVIVGRGSGCDVQIKLEGISRQHCLIEVTEEGEFYVTDLNSSNGVLIDNRRVIPGKKVAYKTFQPLTIGPLTPVTIEPVDRSDRMLVNRSLEDIKRQKKIDPKARKSEHTLVENLPGLELETEEKSRTHHRLTRSGLRKSSSSVRKAPTPVKVETQPPWVTFLLSLFAIIAATYFLFIKK